MIREVIRREPEYRASALSLYQCHSPYNTGNIIGYTRTEVPSSILKKNVLQKENLIDDLANPPPFAALPVYNYISPKRATYLKKKELSYLLHCFP